MGLWRFSFFLSFFRRSVPTYGGGGGEHVHGDSNFSLSYEPDCCTDNDLYVHTCISSGAHTTTRIITMQLGTPQRCERPGT